MTNSVRRQTGRSNTEKGVVGVRRLLCVCLAIVCVLTGAGCTPSADVSDPVSSELEAQISQESPKVFALPYSKEDTLNPYAAATEVNVNLAGLLYDSLTVVDGAFMPQLSLAASVTPTDASHLTVTLRKDALFSDGTAVTVDDVKASFDTARKSERYKELLKNVSAATVDRASGAITFTLIKGDPNAAACLSFPVLKAGNNTTAMGEAPLGGGLYVYTVDESGTYLAANPHHSKTPRYTTVQLRHLPNTESMYYGLSSGNITYYYNDLNSGEAPRVSGASGRVDMNALIYLGVNPARSALGDASVRQAFSLLIDRTTLASSACAGWAYAATLPFHPSWGGIKDIEPLFGKQDLAAAVEKLEIAEQKEWELELIYSLDSGNRATLVDAVRTQLESAGIRVTVIPLAYEEYLTRLKNGQFDLHIGEIRLTANMDLDPLFGGAACYGIDADGEAAEAYARYRAGEGTLQDFLTAFGEELPYIPLLWRCGFAGYDRRLLTVTPHGYDPYYGIADWQ